MRVTAIFWIGATLSAASPATAKTATSHPRSPSGRMVQLIAMRAASPNVTDGSDVEPAEPRALDAATDQFEVHDLSRRWVEFQMAHRLAATRQTEASDVAPDDPFTPQVRARTTAPAAVTYPMIDIPSWMQPGGGVVVPATYAPACDPRPYRPSGFLGVGTEARRQTFYGMMSRIACQYGLPVDLFDAMIIRESRYDPAIVSPKNAFGLTQLMPDTAIGLGVDRYDVVQNLRGGASYLRRQLDRFGQYHLALAAYNAGPGRVRGAVPAIAETRAYVDDILRNWGRLSGFEQPVAPRLLSSAPVLRLPTSRSATLVAFR